MEKYIKYIIIVFIPLFAVIVSLLSESEIKPPESKDGWYGINQIKEGDSIPKDPITIKPFTINIKETILEDLQRRLNSTRFFESIEGTNFNYGFNSNYLKKVVEYWKTKYDWRKQEKQLNKFNQFTTQIEGIHLHFIHVKPTKPAKIVLPLMLIHGWPGSVIEFYKAIPLLTEPVNDIAFEVICPSIPGHGFSEAPHQEGFDVVSTARIFLKLMNRLGHKQFFVHGGDWGSLIGKMLAVIYPESVRGIHITMAGFPKFRGMSALKMLIGSVAPSLIFDDPVNDYNKMYPLLDKIFLLFKELGFMSIQATKPDTLGALLHDSPVGLAAYILEKFAVFTNPNNVNKPDGGLTEKFTMDELLTNVMIYWVNTPVSSVRYYKENFNYKNLIESHLMDIPVLESVPVAVVDPPNELAQLPKAMSAYHYHNIIQHTTIPRGGHFTTFEEPKLIVDDIRKFIQQCLVNEKSYGKN